MSSFADQGQKKTTAGTWCGSYQENVSAVEHHISTCCNVSKPGAATVTFKALACLYLADGTQEKCQKSLGKALTGKVAEEKARMTT